MNDRTVKLSMAIENIDTAYLEEALDFDGAKAGQKKNVRFPKLSAAIVAALVIIALSVTAFAISRIPLSWRDIFSPNQTVISDEDEVPVVSLQPAATDELQITLEKVISDERTLYILYTVKANEGAVLEPKGQFAEVDLYFPEQMMSGAYLPYFLERKNGVPENELEGIILADWQPGSSANGLVIGFSDWQEREPLEDVKVDFNVAEMVENAGKNADLPQCLDYSDDGSPRYLWQPGDADVKLPYGGLSICNAGWEDGVLQLVMKVSVSSTQWSSEENWYFLDTRTGTVIRSEPVVSYRQPDAFDPDIGDTDWRYIWGSVPVDKEALPYLELHWGGNGILTTVLPGQWQVTLDETPVTIESEALAENIPVSYAGKELLAKKIECSKLSMAIYFDDYVDPTTDSWKFEIFDANGDLIPSWWGFIADQTDDSCMFWTRFNEPIEPERVYRLTLNGITVFTRGDNTAK